MVTEGTLLGGRVRYSQPAEGYRTGIEPVLLAASVAANADEHVLEAGTGAGAALLCLCARLPGTSCMGVERDGALAALARSNLAANGFRSAAVTAADVLALPPGPAYHHAIANPPWHDEAGTASPDLGRDAAKRAPAGLLAAWTATLAGVLHPRGTLTLIVPAAAMAGALDAVARAGCGSPALLPLWPRCGQPARLLLIRAVKGGRGPCALLAGLTLHEGEGYSPLARDVLWGGAAICWA